MKMFVNLQSDTCKQRLVGIKNNNSNNNKINHKSIKTILFTYSAIN